MHVGRHTESFGQDDAKQRDGRARADVNGDVGEFLRAQTTVEFDGAHRTVGGDTYSGDDGVADATQIFDDRDQADIDLAEAQLLRQAAGFVE